MSSTSSGEPGRPERMSLGLGWGYVGVRIGLVFAELLRLKGRSTLLRSES